MFHFVKALTVKTETSGFPRSLNFYLTPGHRPSEYCVCFGPERKCVSRRVIITWITVGYSRFVGLLVREDGNSIRLLNTSAEFLKLEAKLECF
jgi:hypothetical protein